SFRLRHFGDRPLVEDGSIRSPTFTAFNTRVGYIVGNWNISLDILNTFDSDDHDITYFYESRLADELAGGVEDIHFHPIEPRNVKLNITWSF
ncbi:MAG: TonB-dependent receptor, partial [Verrucomicrobiota bacterium]